jgi:hypothetical protein
MFAIVTNACLHDHEILAHTVPSWLRVFGDKLSSVWIIVDSDPPSGRIGSRRDIDLNRAALQRCLKYLVSADSRTHVIALEEIPLEAVSRKWFGEVISSRCQAGTPILAFASAFEAVEAALVLRADCDMLFYERGWLSQACEILLNDEADLVEPPRCGFTGSDNTAISSRALMMKPAAFIACYLPIKACRLDWLRRLHRWFHGRSTFVAFEAMLEFQRKKGRFRHVILDSSLGCSIHVIDRCLSPSDWFEVVIRRIEKGDLTSAQSAQDWNFARSAW